MVVEQRQDNKLAKILEKELSTRITMPKLLRKDVEKEQKITKCQEKKQSNLSKKIFHLKLILWKILIVY